MARRLGFWLLTGAREHHWLFPQTSVLAGNKAQNLRQQLCAHTILPYVLASMRCHPPILPLLNGPALALSLSPAHQTNRCIHRMLTQWYGICSARTPFGVPAASHYSHAPVAGCTMHDSGKLVHMRGPLSSLSSQRGQDYNTNTDRNMHSTSKTPQARRGRAKK